MHSTSYNLMVNEWDLKKMQSFLPQLGNIHSLPWLRKEHWNLWCTFGFTELYFPLSNIVMWHWKQVTNELIQICKTEQLKLLNIFILFPRNWQFGLFRQRDCPSSSPQSLWLPSSSLQSLPSTNYIIGWLKTNPLLLEDSQGWIRS